MNYFKINYQIKLKTGVLKDSFSSETFDFVFVFVFFSLFTFLPSLWEHIDCCVTNRIFRFTNDSLLRGKNQKHSLSGICLHVLSNISSYIIQITWRVDQGAVNIIYLWYHIWYKLISDRLSSIESYPGNISCVYSKIWYFFLSLNKILCKQKIFIAYPDHLKESIFLHLQQLFPRRMLRWKRTYLDNRICFETRNKNYNTF